MGIVRDEEHCWRCGRKFDEQITIIAGPIATVVGKVLRADDDAVLCEDCMDDEQVEQLRDSLYGLANLAVESCFENYEKEHGLHKPPPDGTLNK